MAKQLKAKMPILHNGERIEAGDPVDVSDMDKKQLEALYASGAVEISDEEASQVMAPEALAEMRAAEARDEEAKSREEAAKAEEERVLKAQEEKSEKMVTKTTPQGDKPPAEEKAPVNQGVSAGKEESAPKKATSAEKK